MSPKADKVSLSLEGEIACDVASLCKQTTPIDASLDCRVWQASINGVTKCGRRMRSADVPLAYLYNKQSEGKKTNRLLSVPPKLKAMPSSCLVIVRPPT